LVALPLVTAAAMAEVLVTVPRTMMAKRAPLWAGVGVGTKTVMLPSPVRD
jgi:hypothetical protein